MTSSGEVEILCVDVQQVDPVRIELTQARLDRPHHVEAMVAAGVDVLGVSRHRELGAEHDPVPAVLDEAAQDALGRAVHVVHGGVDAVAAVIDVGVEDPPRLALLGAQPQSSSKVMVPSERGETRKPDRPSRR